MMTIPASARPWIVAVIAGLILIAIGIAFWPWKATPAYRGLGTSEGLIAPFAVFARYLPSRSVEIVWSFDPGREGDIKAFHVRMFAASTDLGSASIEPGLRSYVDATHAQAGRAIDYVIAAEDHAGERYYSDVLTVTLPDLDGAPPARPSGLSAEWRVLRGRPIIEVRWTAGDQRSLAGYRVYADDVREGALQARHDPMNPMAERIVAFESANLDDRDVDVAVVAVDSRLWESEPARVSVRSKPAVAIAPAGIETSRAAAPDNPIVVRWTYDAAPGLAGFRVFDRGLEVANETILKADARSWSDSAVLDKWTYAFEVQAVFSDGRMSPLGKGAPFAAALKDQERRPVAPQGLIAEWIAAGEGASVRVSWNLRLPGMEDVQYDLWAKPPGAQEYEFIGRFSADTADYRPPARPGKIMFRMAAVYPDGRRSDSVETEVPGAAAFLMPSRLVDFREGTAGELTLVWRYPQSPIVRGFRLYRNGSLVANEQRLNAASRSWTMRVTDVGRHRFEIEAIAVDGTASPRGPGIDYDRIR